MIILSGLGLNYKTTICNNLEKLYPKLKILISDSSIVQEVADTLGYPAYMDIDRVLIRYSMIKATNPDLVDRGLEDHMIMAKLHQIGWIPSSELDYWKKIGCFWEQYKNLAQSINSERIFLFNKNKKNLRKFIKESLKTQSARSVLYNNVDQYLKVQDRFYEYYYELTKGKHLTFEFLDDDVDKDIQKILRIIKKKIN